MSEAHEKGIDGTGSDYSGPESPVVYERPTGAKGIYHHPITQVAMLGLVCFMCPGLFNALNGLGGAGRKVNDSTSSSANAAVYATFAIAGFFAGTINNKIGPKLTLQIGSLGYSLYIGSYLATNIHPDAQGFVIAAGAILGICAGLLWTAQGSIMLAYPTEQDKGKYIAIFWAIFNLGGVVGASVALGLNFHSEAGEVSNGTYVAFLILTLIGGCIPLLMVDPKNMIRTDGTKVVTPRHPSWKSEFMGLWLVLKTDPWIVILFPLFFSSNWFYTWQFGDFNGALFNIRARALNNVIYWIAQIFGSVVIGILLDRKNISRRARAFSSWVVLFGMVFVVHIWAYFYQRQYSRPGADDPPPASFDIHDKSYIGRMFCYLIMGVLDAMWQTTAYWLMGAMSNDPSKLAYFSGFYKSFQSAGAAGAWAADANKISYMTLFITTWVLLVIGLVFALPMIYLRVKETTALEDETIARMDRSGQVLSAEEVEKRANHAETA